VRATGWRATVADRRRRRLSTGWRRLSLRARLTLTATAALACALVAAAWLFSFTLGRSVTTTLDGSARNSAQQVVALIDADRLPDPILITGDTTIQVVAADGRIQAASPGADRLVALLTGRRLASARRSGHGEFLDGRPYGLAEPLRVVALPAGDGSTVIAATSYDQARYSLGRVARTLLIGTPALLAVLAATSWLVIGGTLRPITELRRGADEITATARSRRLPVPDAGDEVRDLAVTLNTMLDRLADADTRQRALVSDTAHELRSPLASIRTQLEVALDHPEVQDWPSTAGGVLADTLRLARLADDLLVLARLDERGPAPDRRVDLRELTTDVSRRSSTTPTPASFDLAADDGPIEVRGDATGLTRMLTNLIDNATRHAAGRVEVRLDRVGEWARIQVTDDGPGIPAADRERVFARFARLDEGRGRDEGGAGLGLAIVRETARAHGGDVRLEDNAPGLRAVVRLPVLQDPGVPDPGVQDPGVQDPGVQDPGVQDPGVRDPGVPEPGVQDPAVPEPGVQDPDVQEPGVQDPDVRDPAVQEPGVQDPDVQDPDVRDPAVQEPGDAART
jgi:signal transduction histidine kinase